MELTDHELLANFAKSESEEAFEALVARYVNLVYSTALRFTHNSHSAEEITQAVYVILARKAGGLSPRVVLSGWLYQTTRLTAASFVRREVRRQRREQEAYMQSTVNESNAAEWDQIAPLLDDAMGRLGETDRNAVVLRFFENKSAAEVGAALQLSEEAARKRTGRALEKLRRFFDRRGFRSTTAVIGEAVSAHSVLVAPAGLVKIATTVALAKGAAASASTVTLIQGALKIMAWSKAKITLVAGVAVFLTAGTYTTVEVAHWRTAGQGKIILSKVIAANRFWLLAPPDTATDYRYVLHMQWRNADNFPVPSQWTKAADGSIQTAVHVIDPGNAPADEREGATYSSVMQWLAKHPGLARVQSIKKQNGRITLELKFVPAPGAKTFFVMRGKKYPLPPLPIEYGYGTRHVHSDHFTTGGDSAVLVIDEQKMVPLSSVVRNQTQPTEAVEETFSDYAEVSPGNYVPLAVTVKYGGWPRNWGEGVFGSTFKLHNGLWLFDEGQYHDEKVAWTDQVVVN